MGIILKTYKKVGTNSMNNSKIIVCCHKNALLKQSDSYIPVHVGKALTGEDFGLIGDNTGDNISLKNTSYCELTGMYWAWKNLSGVDFIGLCHYRRYFDFNHYGRKVFPATTIKKGSLDEVNVEIDESSIDFLNRGGVILAKSMHFYTSNYFQYCEWHNGSDIRLLFDLIKRTQEPKYVTAFYKSIFQSNIFHPYNMFIMSWQQFDNYCNWLFPILRMIEEEIDITEYSQYQKRIYGYFAERLLNVYVEAEKYKVKEIPVLMLDDETNLYDKSYVKFFLKRCMRDFAFSVLRYTI